MNRRTMLGVSGAAAVGVAVTTACPGAKNLSVYVQTVVGALREIGPLLPGAAGLIAKAITIAEDFDKAYREGKFDNAKVLFENLAGVISQIATDAGVNNAQVKVALLLAGIAMRAIAVLLSVQASNPEVAAALRSRTSPADQRQLALIKKLANEDVINQLFAEVKF